MLAPQTCLGCKAGVQQTMLQTFRHRQYTKQGYRSFGEIAYRGLPGTTACESSYLCRDCWKKLPLIFPLCDAQTYQLMNFNDLINSPSDFREAIVALCHYEGIVQRAILGLKFHGQLQYARLLAEIFLLRLSNQWLCCQEVIFVPIPLSEKRYHHRGYNQAEVILRQALELQQQRLAKVEQVRPFEIQLLLEKNKDTPRQSEMSNMQARFANVRDVFGINKRISKIAKTAKIVIFDDVLTTGATLCEARRTLYQAGYQNVCGLVIATGRMK